MLSLGVTVNRIALTQVLLEKEHSYWLKWYGDHLDMRCESLHCSFSLYFSLCSMSEVGNYK